MDNMSKQRCAWAQSELMISYHDVEWGTPVHDDRVLFEFLTLEGAQAGLSWEIIYKKRANYDLAFDHYNLEAIARYTDDQYARLLENPGIVRNRRKISATIQNARSFLEIQAKYGSFDAWLWGFVDGKPIQNCWKTMFEVPTETLLAKAISKELLAKGFSFVGPTIIYSYMEAVGLVNDHTIDCFRFHELGGVVK